jgi:Paraquat-inducible protein A
MWGLYANMIAQLISQISSHFIVHYHRRIIENAKKEYKRKQGIEALQRLAPDGTNANSFIVPTSEVEAEKASLCRHAFSRQHSVAPEKLTVRRFVNYAMLLGSLMVSILLLVSCDLASMKLEVLGIVALLIELGQNFEQAVRYESVFTISELLVEQAKLLGGVRHYIGLSVLACLFIVTVLLVPVCLIVACLYLWFAPLSAERKKKLATALEVLQAWQYIEVYILAIVIESW